LAGKYKIGSVLFGGIPGTGKSGTFKGKGVFGTLQWHKTPTVSPTLFKKDDEGKGERGNSKPLMG